jgi:hypothetical protein
MLAQTFADLGLAIADNASTVETEEICQESTRLAPACDTTAASATSATDIWPAAKGFCANACFRRQRCVKQFPVPVRAAAYQYVLYQQGSVIEQSVG